MAILDTYLGCSLECGDCGEVIIRLNKSNLLKCPGYFVKARITLEEAPSVNCSAWHYVFTYPDDELGSTDRPLEAGDVLEICCVNCISDFLESLTGPDVVTSMVRNSDGTITYENEVATDFTFQEGWTDVSVEGAVLTFTFPDSNSVTVDVCQIIQDSCGGIAPTIVPGPGACEFTFNDGLGSSTVVDLGNSTLANTGTTTSGSNEFTHVDCLGVQTTLCEGFDSVRASAGCATPGVDAGKVVRSITIENKELVVDSAPEHHSVVSFGSISDGGISQLVVPGQRYCSPATTTASITNPSACRSMIVRYNLDRVLDLLIPPGGGVNFEHELSISGGAFTVSEISRLNVPDYTFDGTYLHPGNQQTILAPGATITIAARSCFINTSGVAFTVNGVSLSVEILGVTS